jgi:trypsin-like peptidase
MDAQQVLADTAIRQELLERLDELADRAPRQPGLEGLEGGIALDAATDIVGQMAEGRYQAGANAGIEAIVERFTRPSYLVQRSTFFAPPDDFPDSDEIQRMLDRGRQGLERAIPSVGRVDLRNHRLDWVGTGWVVAPELVITNRHVAREFAVEGNGGFVLRDNNNAPPVRADVDWRHEHQQQATSSFRIKEVLWIEPDASVDVAVLRIADRGEDDEPGPDPIELMTRAELRAAGVAAWVAVIGYPAFDSRNDRADQQRIFDGIYNVKRLAPGQVLALVGEDTLHHDATTLGGNSGSVVLDIASGKAAGLHFGGIEGDRNEAVQAPRVREVVEPFLA